MTSHAIKPWTVPGYTTLSELGRGSSGIVTLARHDESGTQVAIKYLSARLCADKAFVEAFRTEAEQMLAVDVPQVARLCEYVEGPEGAAIVMELVDGVALRAVLRRHRQLPPEAALVILKDSLVGLAAAHRRGVVHRDYKPENVLVTEDGHSKLVDFGIAARTGECGPLAGTPAYMAPEQWAGAAAAPSTDIYAATATLFECLVGHSPFNASGDIMELRRRHEQEPVPIGLVPEAMRGLISRGMAKSSRQRPQDAREFLAQLEAAAGRRYGRRWESTGRHLLAQRVLALSAFFHKPAGSPTYGTAVATTRLSRMRRTLAPALLAAFVAGSTWTVASTWKGTAAQPGPNPSFATGSLDPLPSYSRGPNPASGPAQPTPSPTRAPNIRRPAASNRPGTSPTPTPGPPNSVRRMTMTEFCWDAGSVCGVDDYSHSSGRARARITIDTTSDSAYNVTFTFFQVAADGTQIGTPVVLNKEVPGGRTVNEITVVVPLTALTADCTSQYRIKVDAETSISGPTSNSLSIVDMACLT